LLLPLLLCVQVLPDAGQLLLLLLEGYTNVGDAFMAGGPNVGSTSSSSSSGSGKPSLPPLCRPADAARAYLTALNLVPDVSAFSSISTRDAALAAAVVEGLYGDPAQLRRQLQSKLNAAQELLSDAEQTAVLTAAAVASVSETSRESWVQGGRQLALMQLGLPASPLGDKVSP
jgi:hypothetical protein